MSKPPPAVVKNVARRMAYETKCGDATARSVTEFVLENLTTDELIELAKSHGQDLLLVSSTSTE